MDTKYKFQECPKCARKLVLCASCRNNRMIIANLEQEIMILSAIKQATDELREPTLEHKALDFEKPAQPPMKYCPIALSGKCLQSCPHQGEHAEVPGCSNPCKGVICYNVPPKQEVKRIYVKHCQLCGKELPWPMGMVDAICASGCGFPDANAACTDALGLFPQYTEQMIQEVVDAIEQSKQPSCCKHKEFQFTHYGKGRTDVVFKCHYMENSKSKESYCAMGPLEDQSRCRGYAATGEKSLKSFCMPCYTSLSVKRVLFMCDSYDSCPLVNRGDTRCSGFRYITVPRHERYNVAQFLQRCINNAVPATYIRKDDYSRQARKIAKSERS